jgi:hypothetical protein
MWRQQLAVLDKDVERCLRMYKMYATETHVTSLQLEREQLTHYQDMRRDTQSPRVIDNQVTT